MSFRVCRHIKTNGLQCQSPSMRGDLFCYFHTTLRRRHLPAAGRPDTGTMRPVYDAAGNFDGMEPAITPPGSIELGLLEDSASVQIAISTVINALAGNRLEVRRATALLYGLQLAASNCRSMRNDYTDPDKVLREVVTDDRGDPIAKPGLNSGQEWAYPRDPDAFGFTDEDSEDSADDEEEDGFDEADDMEDGEWDEEKDSPDEEVGRDGDRNEDEDVAEAAAEPSSSRLRTRVRVALLLPAASSHDVSPAASGTCPQAERNEEFAGPER